mmetsp:Transcript_21950/g.30753  ORF Transcript_21950/g.30753 Transcript_21950/m.30753 type:complete len:84 (-) Transcript_21950:75-326(-)
MRGSTIYFDDIGKMYESFFTDYFPYWVAVSTLGILIQRPVIWSKIFKEQYVVAHPAPLFGLDTENILQILAGERTTRLRFIAL